MSKMNRKFILLLSLIMLVCGSSQTFSGIPLSIPLNGKDVIPFSTAPDYCSGSAYESSHFDYDTNYTIICTLSNDSSEDIDISIYNGNIVNAWDSVTFNGITKTDFISDFKLPHGTYELKVNRFRLVGNQGHWGHIAIQNNSRQNNISVSSCMAYPYF